jgi:Zn-finger nucleic acid-binding protein
MNCPACGNILQEKTVEDLVVDVCQGGCGGIWFDNFEIQKFDEPHESAGEALLDIERDESIVIDHTKRLKCPACDDMVMMRHFFSVKKEVEAKFAVFSIQKRKDTKRPKNISRKSLAAN